MNASLHCPACGAANAATALVCAICGQALVSPGAPSFVAIAKGEVLPAKPLLPGADKWRRPLTERVEVAMEELFPGDADAAEEVSADDIIDDDATTELPAAALATPEPDAGLSPASADATPLGEATALSEEAAPSGEVPLSGEAAPSEEAAPEPIVVAPVVVPPPPLVIRARLVPLWQRALAGLIDLVPVLLVALLVLLIGQGRLEAARLPLIPRTLDELALWFWALGPGLMIGLFVATAVVTIAYHALSLIYMQGTVGDALFGIRWITRRGQRPGRVRATWRAALLFLSWLAFAAGAMLVIVTRTRRTFYDLASGLYPVKASSCEFETPPPAL